LASAAGAGPTFAKPQRGHYFCRIRNWLKMQMTLNLRPVPLAVCVPPGARLILQGIPQAMQRLLQVGETEEVRFVQMSAEANTYRDAVLFHNERQALLQSLRVGQVVTVVSLGGEPKDMDSEDSLDRSQREPEALVA